MGVVAVAECRALRYIIFILIDLVEVVDSLDLKALAKCFVHTSFLPPSLAVSANFTSTSRFDHIKLIYMASIDELIAELSLNPEREPVASELGGASCSWKH